MKCSWIETVGREGGGSRDRIRGWDLKAEVDMNGL